MASCMMVFVVKAIELEVVGMSDGCEFEGGLNFFCWPREAGGSRTKTISVVGTCEY